jgi:alkylation response protein AidB-like acyl-CoA dehydrogenase
VWRAASDDLIDRWLRPALRGELHDAYAVTEADAGSDPSGISTVARRDGNDWRVTGEKSFVTFGSVAAVFVVMANVVDGDRLLPRLFAVPADADGIKTVADVPFTHSFPHGHPTIAFDGVRVTDADVIGTLGGGEDLQRQWFTEERLAIAARCGGATLRSLRGAAMLFGARGRPAVSAAAIGSLATAAATAAAEALIRLDLHTIELNPVICTRPVRLPSTRCCD